jgi:hypothetical protein
VPIAFGTSSVVTLYASSLVARLRSERPDLFVGYVPPLEAGMSALAAAAAVKATLATVGSVAAATARAQREARFLVSGVRTHTHVSLLLMIPFRMCFYFFLRRVAHYLDTHIHTCLRLR